MASLFVKTIGNTLKRRIAKNRETIDSLKPHRSHQNFIGLIFSLKSDLQQKEAPKPHTRPHIRTSNILQRLRVRVSVAFSRYKNLVLSVEQPNSRTVTPLRRCLIA